MPSSLLELTNQLGVNCEQPEQLVASGGSGARSIILTFPGLPSCCTEITINFEDDNGSDSKGTQSEEVDLRLPTHDFSTKTREELVQPYQFQTCEDGVAHEFDQSTVYIGLDCGLTAGRKKARKKTESLVRTLPILAHCSKRWLNFRGRKGHERGRICAFESGDVGKINSSSTSVDDGTDSPGQKLDTKQGFVSARTPLTFLNSMTTFSKSSSHDRKKSLERSHDTRAVKHSSRKSKSGVGISETKPETSPGDEVDAVSPKQKSDPSMNQIIINNLPQLTRSKHNPQVEFDLSDSHEKVKKHDGGRYSETNKDRCKVAKAKETDLLTEGGPQLLSKPSCLSRSMPSESSSKLDSKTAGHKALDTMFVDVIKMLVAQEDPQNAKRSPSLGEQQENHTLQADPWGKSTRQQTYKYHAFGNTKSRTTDQGSKWEDSKLQENVLGGSISRNGLPRCDVSGLNFPLRTNSYDRNISCGRNIYCDRNIICGKIKGSERNISCDRNMGYDKTQNCERNVSCDRNMGYDKTQNCERNVSCDRNIGYGKYQDCARNFSCDRNMSYGKNQDCVRNISCERSKSFDRSIPCDIYISSNGNTSCYRKNSCAGNINCDKHISCGRKKICDTNISCEKKYCSQHQTTKGNSNNCHLCCWEEVSECKEFFDSASSSDDSLRGSVGINEDLLSSEERKLGFREEGSRTSKVQEMGRSLQGRLQNAADDKQTGGTSRNSDQNGEKLAVPVLSELPEPNHSFSQGNIRGLQHLEQSREASIWNDPKDDLSNSVATKAEGNAGSFQNAKYVFQSGNYITRKDQDDSTCSHIPIHRGIAKALYDNNNFDSAACVHNCSRASSCRQCNERRRITKEREDGNESQLSVAGGRSLTKENGSHKSVPKHSVVAVKSSKLHKIFSKSSEITRRPEGRPSGCDYTPLGYKNPGDVQLTSGNLDDTMSSISVNLNSEDEEFRLVQQQKSKENVCSVVLQTAGSLNAKVTPLLGQFISTEKRKCRLSLASSFIGKAKTALSCVRSRSSSPAALGKKIKNMFFRESVDRILSKNPTAILKTEKDTRQGSGSNQENSSRQDVGSKQVAVSKDRVDLKLVVRSKKKANVSAIPKDLGSPYWSTDLDGSIAKEYYKPLIITTQTSGQDSLKLDEENNAEHGFSRSEASSSRSDETKPEISQSQTDSTSVRIHSATFSDTARSESASFDNPTTSDILDLSVDLRRKIKQYLDGQFKMAPQILPTFAPFTVIIPPSLEVIAEAESPSEESKADEEMAKIKYERLIGSDNLTKVIVSKGTKLECDNGLCALSTSSSVRSTQTCGRKLDLRMCSFYEDCTREFEDVSLGNNVLKRAPMRTHSSLSTFEAAQTELQAISVMAINSREVKMKRYPSFPNLTDINNEDLYVSPVNPSGSNDCIVSSDTCEENPLLVKKNDETRLRDSLNLGSFPASKTQAECTTVNNRGRTIQKAEQWELPPNLDVQGKINTDLNPDPQNFELQNGETKISTVCTQSWMDSENCEDTLSCGSCSTTSTKLNDATPKNSAGLVTHEKKRSTKYSDIIFWNPQIDEAVDEVVILLPSSPNDSIHETLKEFEFEKVHLKNMPTTSKLLGGVDNYGDRIQLLRAALCQDDTLVDVRMSIEKDLNNVAFQEKGRHLLKENEQKCLIKLYNYLPYRGKPLLREGEQKSLTNVLNCFSCKGEQLLQDKEQNSFTKLCNYFPCNQQPLNSHDCDKSSPSYPKPGGHLNDRNICCTTTDKNTRNINILVEHRNDEETLKETREKVCRDFSHSNDKKEFCREDTVNRDNSFTGLYSSNIADGLFTVATYQFPTIAANRYSINTKKQLPTTTVKQHSVNTENQFPTNTTNQLLVNTADQLSTNTTNQLLVNTVVQLPTNTTNQLLVNTADQLPTNTTNQLRTINPLSTNTTNHLSTDAAANTLRPDTTNQIFTKTINEASATNTTKGHARNTTNQLATDTTYQISKMDSRMAHSSLTDPDVKLTFRENNEAIVPSSLNYKNCTQPAYSTHLQTQFLFVADSLRFAESVDTGAVEEGNISSISRETTPRSFIKLDGVGNESPGTADVEQKSTCRDEEVVDTCNSCLSDVELEDNFTGNDKSSLNEKLSKNDSASSITKTANRRKKVKTNNKYALTATIFKLIPVKSETVLAETANTKTSKPSGLNSVTEFTKGGSKGRKMRSKNMNNTASGLLEVRGDTIDVDTTSFRGSNLFVVTSTSSIFGAPDKRAASGLKSIKSPTKTSLVTNQIFKPELEETDDEDSDTLTNTGFDKTRSSNIQEENKVNSKSHWDVVENETPKIDSQTQTGQMFDTIRKDKTDVNAQSLLISSLHSASSCVNRGHSSLDITLCRNYALRKAPQMNLGNSSHQSLDRPKLPLLKTTSCYNCARHKTPSAFPAQNCLSRTMSKKLAHRTTWSSRTGLTKEDFTNRARYHLQRCDEVLQRSTGVINKSQEMSVRAHHQMEHTAEKLKLLKWADSSGPE